MHSELSKVADVGEQISPCVANLETRRLSLLLFRCIQLVQCVAVCCSVLQCVRVLHGDAV